jgi:hypothetical protein
MICYIFWEFEKLSEIKLPLTATLNGIWQIWLVIEWSFLWLKQKGHLAKVQGLNKKCFVTFGKFFYFIWKG